MSVTFTKLFSSITESTIWVAPDAHRLTWITMLAMADRSGRVWASIPGLANRARLPIQAVEEALQAFMSPDPYSRTKDNEGRRIEEIDGGWRLLNHAKYRTIRDEESIKESKRKYINTRREQERLSKGVDNVELCRGNAEAEAEAEAEAIKPLEQKATAFARFWSAYPKKKNKGHAERAFKKLPKNAEFVEAMLAALDSAKRSEAWIKDGGQYIPYPATWLNAKGWEDEEQVELGHIGPAPRPAILEEMDKPIAATADGRSEGLAKLRELVK